MKVLFYFCLLSLVAALSPWWSNRCDTDSDCQPTQCCQSADSLMVQTKRSVPTSLRSSYFYPWRPASGSCIDYVKAGDRCDYLMSGDCGCAPGLQCTHYDQQTTPPAISRPLILTKRLIISGPGYSVCEAPPVSSGQQSGCTDSSDCATNQCCVAGQNFLIQTKRDLGSLLAPPSSTPGECVDYMQEGDNCLYSSLTDCGCAPGLSCVRYEEELPHFKRDAVEQSGKAICESKAAYGQ